MKKRYWQVIIIPLVLGALLCSGCEKDADNGVSEPSKSVKQEKRPEPDWSGLELGEPISVKLEYRSCNGNEDEWPGRFRWYSSKEPEKKVETLFIKSAEEKAGDNSLFVFSSTVLGKKNYAALEYKDTDVLGLYLDLDRDNELDEGERFEMDENIANRFGDYGSFITPDFRITGEYGETLPLKLLVCPFMKDGQFKVRCSSVCQFEGDLVFKGKSYKMMVPFNVYKQSYAVYGSSYFTLVEEEGIAEKPFLPATRLSSLLKIDDSYYRFRLDRVSDIEMKAVLAEDKSAVNSFTCKVKDKDAILCDLTYTLIEGKNDPTLSMIIGKEMSAIPVGDYRLVYGSMSYGESELKEFMASFRDADTITIAKDNPTVIEVGGIKADILVTEKGDKKSKTEFSKDSTLIIDASFVGSSGEKYSGFRKKYLDENNKARYERLSAHLVITDSKGDSLVDQDMEYG